LHTENLDLDDIKWIHKKQKALIIIQLTVL